MSSSTCEVRHVNCLRVPVPRAARPARRGPGQRLRADQGVRAQPRPLRLAGRAHQHLPGAGQAGRSRAGPGGERGPARGARPTTSPPDGRAELRSWLLRRAGQRPSVRNELVLRMFLLSALPPKDQRLMLTAIAERTAAAAAELRAPAGRPPAPDRGPRADFGRLAGEFGAAPVRRGQRVGALGARRARRSRPGRPRPTRPRPTRPRPPSPTTPDRAGRPAIRPSSVR